MVTCTQSKPYNTGVTYCLALPLPAKLAAKHAGGVWQASARYLYHAGTLSHRSTSSVGWRLVPAGCLSQMCKEMDCLIQVDKARSSTCCMNCPSQLSLREPSWATDTAGLPRRSPEAISVGHAAMACCTTMVLSSVNSLLCPATFPFVAEVHVNLIRPLV